MARLRKTGSVLCGVCSTYCEQHGAGRFWGFARNDRDGRRQTVRLPPYKKMYEGSVKYFV